MAWTDAELGALDIRYWLAANPDSCPNCGNKWFSPLQNAYQHWTGNCKAQAAHQALGEKEGGQ